MPSLNFSIPSEPPPPTVKPLIDPPYVLFLGDAPDPLAAKTAQGLVDWRKDDCLGQIRMPGCMADLGLPDLTVDEAVGAGARTFVIGIANPGGFITADWIPYLMAALEAGLDLASGLHHRLDKVPGLSAAAQRTGHRLIDVRHPSQEFQTGKGTARTGHRLLTVGTDCSIGKMYTTLAIEKEMKSRGIKADFKATGQSGILIAGQGVAIDAVAADFISGAAEWLTPAGAADHWDLIEGQGSLYHPSFAGVTLGLLHGAQPDALVLCHEPTRNHMRGLASQSIPSISQCLEGYVEAARLTAPNPRFVGIAVNTAALDASTALGYLEFLELEFDLVTTDPMRFGMARLVDALATW